MLMIVHQLIWGGVCIVKAIKVYPIKEPNSGKSDKHVYKCTSVQGTRYKVQGTPYVQLMELIMNGNLRLSFFFL